MNFVIDLILIGIILIFVLTSAKKGFVSVVVSTVGFVIAILLALNLSTPLGQATYDKAIEPAFVKSIVQSAEHNSSEKVENVWETLPEFVKNNSNIFGITEEDFNDKISQNISENVEDSVMSASQNVIRPVAVKIISMIYSVILTIVLLFVVNILSKVINKLFSFSVVGKLNRTLGGLLGIIKGCVVALIFCLIISTIVSLNSEGFLFFTQENTDKTFLFKNMVKLIPFSI